MRALTRSLHLFLLLVLTPLVVSCSPLRPLRWRQAVLMRIPPVCKARPPF